MRAPLLVLLLLVALGAGVWLTTRGDDAPPAPPPVTAPDAPAAPVAPAAQTDRRIEPATPAPPPMTAPGDAGVVPDTPPPAPPMNAPANVVLAVRGLVTRTPVDRFRWQFRNTRGTTRGDGDGGRAELVLEPSAVGELLVEADGFAPWLRAGVVVPTPPAAALAVDVLLAPAVPAAGVTLFVRDLALTPVPHVRVDVFALPVPAPPQWQLGAAMWARRSAAADGRYTLPPLPAGDYGIRVVATDADGVLLPLLPYRNTFTLTGDNGFVEDAPLAPGALLTLDLREPSGVPLDAARAAGVGLRLTLPGGPAVPRKWTSRADDVAVAAIDGVPGPGPVSLAEAVEAGPYTLDVLGTGGVRVQRQLFLRPGLVHEERVVVP